MSKHYRIFGAKYLLSEKLIASENNNYPVEVTPKNKVFHIEITQDKKRVAFLTRKTYDEAKAIGEEYCYGNEHQT